MAREFRTQLKLSLSPAEDSFFKRLKTPDAIQSYLDSLPINFENAGETYASPRRTIAAKTAHCFEGALLAAAAVAYHGGKPLLMDLQTAYDDEDHVVALFTVDGHWGAFSKTNHPILRYRDPVYKSVRELAMSYFHEYFMIDGKKSLRTYSKPFDLSKYAPEKWVTAGEDLHWLVDELDWSPHFPLISKKMESGLRRSSTLERRAVEMTEWLPSGKRRKL